MHGHGERMFRPISLDWLQARSKAVSHRHGRVLLPDRSDAGHGQMLKRQAASTAAQSSSNDMT